MRKCEASIKVSAEPLLITWAERDLNWRDSNLPLADKHGWQRARIGSAIGGVNFSFFPQFLPVGQASPFHIADNMEFFVFMLEGQIEFGVGPNPDDLQYFRVGQYDTLFVPLGMGVDYRNTGKADALFLVTSSRIGEWPKEVIYHLPGQDQPFARKL